MNEGTRKEDGSSEYSFIANLVPVNLRGKFKQREKEYLRQLTYFINNREKYGLRPESVPRLRVGIYLKIIYEIIVLPADMLNQMMAYPSNSKIKGVKIGTY